MKILVIEGIIYIKDVFMTGRVYENELVCCVLHRSKADNRISKPKKVPFDSVETVERRFFYITFKRCNMKNLKKLKRAVIKEELVALTGGFVDAVILNQLIYWSERVSDFDKFIEQEKARAKNHGEDVNIDTTCGWIYKTAEELSEETMLNISKQNMRLHLKELVRLGYIQERENPKYKWDKTKQYRVNIVKIQNDLDKLGYCLDGYSKILKCDSEVQEIKLRGENLEHQVNNLRLQSEQNMTAIPETTTKINTDIYNRAHKKKKIHDLNMDSQRANNFMSHTGAPSDFNGDLNDWYLECMDVLK